MLRRDQRDLALMNGRQIADLLRRRGAVAGRAPGHDIGDVDACCGRARWPRACGRAAGRSGRRRAGRCRSSSRPGASPTNISRASGAPSAKTRREAVLRSAQPSKRSSVARKLVEGLRRLRLRRGPRARPRRHGWSGARAPAPAAGAGRTAPRRTRAGRRPAAKAIDWAPRRAQTSTPISRYQRKQSAGPRRGKRRGRHRADVALPGAGRKGAACVGAALTALSRLMPHQWCPRPAGVAGEVRALRMVALRRLRSRRRLALLAVGLCYVAASSPAHGPATAPVRRERPVPCIRRGQRAPMSSGRACSSLPVRPRPARASRAAGCAIEASLAIEPSTASRRQRWPREPARRPDPREAKAGASRFAGADAQRQGRPSPVAPAARRRATRCRGAARTSRGRSLPA